MTGARPLSILQPAPLSRRLWLAGLAAALFILTLAVGNTILPANRSMTPDDVGLDFLPFYTAGSFVRTGHTDRLYDLPAIFAAEQATARAEHLALGNRAGGPFWNPPFYARLFAPLSALPYRIALLIWTLTNLAALIIALRLLTGMLPQQTPWHTRALVPLLVLVSMPFIQAISHGQNTFTSLLILTTTVVFWRRRRAIAAGIACGLLFYKPQLATLVALVLALDLGAQAAAATASVGAVFAGISLIPYPHPATVVRPPLPLNLDSVLPAFLKNSPLADYAARLPGILRNLQDLHPYAWERHPTLRSLVRMLTQGTAAGPTHLLAMLLATAIAASLAAGLVLAVRRARPLGADDCWTGLTPAVRRDRLIAATICCTPLLAPFYFDYDLLLLAIPAVLLASERLAITAAADTSGRWAARLFCLLAIVLVFNIAFSKATTLNLAATILLLEAVFLIARACHTVDPYVLTRRIYVRRLLHLRPAA